MRVRAPDGGDAPVEIKAHGALFARALGVVVDEDDLRLHLLQNLVGDEEGVIRVHVEREAAHEVHDRELDAALRLEFAPAAPRALRREVRRAQNALVRVQIGLQLIAHPGVVAERDHVRAGGEKIVRLPGRDADDVGVLPVHDAEIDILFGLERLETLG